MPGDSLVVLSDCNLYAPHYEWNFDGDGVTADITLDLR